ncbi:MAG: hypothetical protein AAFO79_00180 [Pseudomonadota bacterium]
MRLTEQALKEGRMLRCPQTMQFITEAPTRVEDCAYIRRHEKAGVIERLDSADARPSAAGHGDGNVEARDDYDSEDEVAA